jgi:UTP--glucose-1-phosphate uridylyltransferase
MIKNEKTVDPLDPSSPAVIQIESAMGAAIEVFEGATAIGVGRDRFLPVKTTSDLLLVRSDVYDLDSEGRITKITDPAPLIELDSSYYKTIGAFEHRFSAGPPSLRAATTLAVKGDWTFGDGVTVVGAVRLDDKGSPQTVPAGSVLTGD